MDLWRVCLLYLWGHLHKTLAASRQVTKTCAHLFLLSLWSPHSLQQRRKRNGRLVKCPRDVMEETLTDPQFYFDFILHQIKSEPMESKFLFTALKNDILKGQLQVI